MVRSLFLLTICILLSGFPSVISYATVLTDNDSISTLCNFQEIEAATDSIELEKMLDEIIVEGQRKSTKNATGEIFTLSSTAKKSGDPYVALSEIPLLQVDIATRQVTTRDGVKPLILVDGKIVNSGIDPIDPSVIESVEVTEVANAKFLHMGVSKILNIKLKRDAPRYLFAELRTRHGVIPSYGLAGGRFEYGSPKVAIYADLFGTYTVKNSSDIQIQEAIENLSKVRNGTNSNRSLGWNGEVMLKWQPSQNDYFSLVIKGLQSFGRGYGATEGFISTLTNAPQDNSIYTLATKSNSLNNLGGSITGIFYDHTFNDQSILSVFGYYNYAKGNDKETLIESIDNSSSSYVAGEISTRNQYHLAIDYDTGSKPYGSFLAGYSMMQTHNKSFSNANPQADPMSINLFDNFIHITYSNMVKKCYYMVSAGLQYMNVDCGRQHNSFWRPKASASITWVAPKDNTFRLSYTLSNEMPATNYLATFNTSTDPWLIIRGNPYLTPYALHQLSLDYNKRIGRLYLFSEAKYRASTDRIDNWLYTEGATAISSWRNNGTWQSPMIKAGVTWSGYPVRGSITYAYIWESFDHSHYQGHSAIEALGIAYLKKFIIQASVGWINKSYTATGYTKYYNPLQASIMLSWRPNTHIEVVAGMDYWCGIKKSMTIIRTDGFMSSTLTRFTGESLKPFILFAWTLRRNPQHSISDKMPSI